MTLLFLTFRKNKKIRSVTISLACKTISTSSKGIPQCTTKVQPLHSRHSRCSTKWHGGPRRQLDTTRLIHIKASKMRSKAPLTGRFFYVRSQAGCCGATMPGRLQGGPLVQTPASPSDTRQQARGRSRHAPIAGSTPWNGFLFPSPRLWPGLLIPSWAVAASF